MKKIEGNEPWSVTSLGAHLMKDVYVTECGAEPSLFSVQQSPWEPLERDFGGSECSVQTLLCSEVCLQPYKHCTSLPTYT